VDTRGETNLARKAFRPPKQEETTKKNPLYYEKDGAPRTFLRFRVEVPRP